MFLCDLALIPELYCVKNRPQENYFLQFFQEILRIVPIRRVFGPLQSTGSCRSGSGSISGFPGIRFALARAALPSGRRLGQGRRLDDVIDDGNFDDVINHRSFSELEHVFTGRVGRGAEHEGVDVLKK